MRWNMLERGGTPWNALEHRAALIEHEMKAKAQSRQEIRSASSRFCVPICFHSARISLLHQLLSLLRKKLRIRATHFEKPLKVPEN